MKLPKLEDKFVITEKKSPCYGNVVSGVHLDVRADEDNPDRLWYYVRVDRAYEGDVISCYGGYVYASLTLEGAFDYVAQYLTPYQEQEEKADEGSVVEKEDNEDAERFGQRYVYSCNFEIPVYDDVFLSGVCIGHSFSASSAISSITRSLGGVSLA